MSAVLADPPLAANTKLAPPPSWNEVVRRGSPVVLREMTWDDYERFDSYFMEHGGGHVSFLDGILEIMPTSKIHETIKRTIGRLIEDYAIEQNIEVVSWGQATIGERKKNASKEPDDFFVFGRTPTDDDRADLVVEVVITSSAVNKLDFYERFAIPELWIWEKGLINVYILKNDGTGYAQQSRSELFPDLNPNWIEQAAQKPTLSQAVQEFRRLLEH